MMKRPFVVMLILSLLVVTTFSACRKKEPTPGAKDYSGIELTYYKVFEDEDTIEPLIRDFEVQHPGLKINFKKFADFSEYQQLVLNEMAEGQGPDILSMQNTWFVTNYKKLAPMPKSFGEPTDFADTFVDVAYRDLVRPDDDGILQVYAAPMTVDSLALYYNKDQFEDALPESGKPSDTWEGIKEDVSFLNKQDDSFDRFELSGIALGRADNILRAVDIFYLLMLQFGADVYNDNISGAVFADLQPFAGDFPAKEALDLYVSFADDTKKNYSWNEFVVDDNSAEKEIEAFARGDVSMIVGYAYTYDLIMNELSVLRNDGVKGIDEDAVRIAPIPQVYDPDTSSEKRVTYASYFAEGVSRNSENSDLAWEFLLFITEKDNLEYYFDESHKPTSRRDLIDDQKKHPIYGVFATQAGFAESFPIFDFYRYEEIFKNAIFSANSGENVSTALANAQKLVNQMIPKEGILSEVNDQ